MVSPRNPEAFITFFIYHARSGSTRFGVNMLTRWNGTCYNSQSYHWPSISNLRVRFWGSHSGDYEEYNFVEHNAV
jgi:hypothetical protein